MARLTFPTSICLAFAFASASLCSGCDNAGQQEQLGPELDAPAPQDDDDNDSTGHDEAEPSPSPERARPDACDPACADLDSGVGLATCHACRCKSAFDGWLPAPEVLQCGNAEPIVTYHAELTEAGFALEPAAPAATKCANPSLLTGSCRQGSRLGHVVHGDVSVYWICRDPYLDYDGSVLYEDMAIVGHNARTGATCFWDDVNDVMHDDDAPALDLQTAAPDERAEFVERFAYTDGSGCIGCHDHDPFLYTPYLRATNWDSVAADKGPYHLVGLGPEPRATEVMHLVSADAAPCTSCHRLGSENTCTFFAPNALGDANTLSHEAEVHAAAEPGSPHWPLALWMPADTSATPEFADWQAAYGRAREHILECCESPGEDVQGCRWAPVPSVAPR